MRSVCSGSIVLSTSARRQYRDRLNFQKCALARKRRGDVDELINRQNSWGRAAERFVDAMRSIMTRKAG